jgi:hypothetical protein
VGACWQPGQTDNAAALLQSAAHTTAPQCATFGFFIWSFASSWAAHLARGWSFSAFVNAGR